MGSCPVIIVTGAAGGIGYETVRILLQDLNAKVVATDLNVDRLKDLKNEFSQSLEIQAADIVESSTATMLVTTALKSFGKLDGICLIAGVFGPCLRMENANVSEWEKAFRINVFSHLHIYRAAIPEVRKTKGRIVLATSGAGHGALFSGWGFYSMSKTAVAFSVSQLKLEEPSIITVGVSPGLCDTKMVRDLMKGQHVGQTAEDVAHYNSFVAKIPMITPRVAGNAFARTVVSADSSLSGEVVDYDDHRLPLDEAAKRDTSENRIGNMDYTKLTT
ncbi:uncharacterized protein Z520_07751 [Fonsecaea multimorphosa CBS 102226]|uniref:NAD(P)-binding protein n=1 Tax=Fonsecaea multimorphosa CBS 102226 TaxID=1442371 RepID=A0A0D2H3S0_9EURO|nr:uncharacterized protein Z520_07751 [Fonsecaea multimorphosa CBS 102226]KIX96485.1 hypothetical protein Z520_07751 [Fonsecaea multimorphosa CBS 102226]OAL28314.1 hypothetical protein AYO22_03020 [Fonsecaea multimorphosa]